VGGVLKDIRVWKIFGKKGGSPNKIGNRGRVWKSPFSWGKIVNPSGYNKDPYN